MKRRIGSLLLALALLLTGCGGGDSENPASAGLEGETQNSKSAMVAQQVTQEREENDFIARLQYVDGNVYYTVLDYEEDLAERQLTVVRRTGEREERLFSLYGEETQNMRAIAADSGGNLYLFLSQPDEDCEIVVKLDENQQEIYRTELSLQLGQEEYLQCAQATENGQVLTMTSLGRCVAIDESGSQIKVSDTTWYRESLTVEACGLANAGDEGLYGYSFENGTLYVEKYLPETGKWEEGILVSPPEGEAVSGQGAWCGVYSGEEGLLLATGQGLWKLNPASGELTVCFSFQDTYVNLQGGEVQFAAQLPEEGYLLMLYGQGQQSFVAVEPQEASALTPKQEIMLGSIKGYEYPSEEITAYNGSQQAYYLVQETYDSMEELNLALVQGNGPDLFNMSKMTVEEMSAKGILADLTPLMGENSRVHPEDLLPSVRETCTLDVGIRFLYPNFLIPCLVMKKGTAADGGISVEAFLNMGTGQDTYLINYSGMMSHTVVLNLVILNDMEMFVDWESRSCSFDSPEFISILKDISALKEPEDPYKELPESDLSPAAALREGEYLVYFTVIGSMNGYLDLLEAFGDYADIVSYPTQTGEARYTMVNNDALGINSASANQEGAWDFIEYVLLRATEDFSFSVLQETFEDQLFPDFSSDKTHYNQYLGETLPVGRDAVTEEQAEEMRNIIAHSVWNNPIDCREIRSIIQEETAYFFEGDKTAEDVADIIQRRVTLLLNE